MWQWTKKLFKEEPKPKTKMVEVLRELWDIRDKEREAPPTNVDTDIYHVLPRDKAVPHRSSTRRQHYKKL